MNKELSEMTIEEQWGLFPISLDCRISHIGSTAISEIKAKNIIDVLVEIPSGANIEDVANLYFGDNDELYFKGLSERVSGSCKRV